MKKNPDKKKAISIKNILLGVSLAPYAVFLVWGLINCIVQSIKSKCFDLFTILEPVIGFWEIVWFEFDIFCVLISLFAIVYPIYYLIDSVTRKSENQPTDATENKKVSKLFILFLLSFLPYLLMGYFSTVGLDFGLFSSSYLIFGFDALITVLITCSVIPVYPVALIFQIIYLIKQYKKLTKKSKLITKCTIIAVVVFTLVPSLIYMAMEKIEAATNFESDKIVIENYLKDEFGEQHFKDMEIIKNKNTSRKYLVKTPLLDNNFVIELNRDRTEISDNSFYEDFNKQNDLDNKLSKRLSEQYGLPENVQINTLYLNYDISKYTNSSNVDDLLDDCEYSIGSVYIYVDSYDTEEITEIIKDYYLKYDDSLNQNDDTSGAESQTLAFYVKLDDELYADVLVYRAAQQPDTLKLSFGGYTDSNGTTIDDSEITVDLYEQ